MTQSIDPIRLKAAAEHLEWVLQQYPHSEDVQGLLRSLTLLIEEAKAGRVKAPLSANDVPGARDHADGAFTPYKSPDVGDAYAKFRTELKGGLTEQDALINARIAAMQAALTGGRADE